MHHVSSYFVIRGKGTCEDGWYQIFPDEQQPDKTNSSSDCQQVRLPASPQYGISPIVRIFSDFKSAPQTSAQPGYPFTRCNLSSAPFAPLHQGNRVQKDLNDDSNALRKPPSQAKNEKNKSGELTLIPDRGKSLHGEQTEENMSRGQLAKLVTGTVHAKNWKIKGDCKLSTKAIACEIENVLCNMVKSVASCHSEHGVHTGRVAKARRMTLNVVANTHHADGSHAIGSLSMLHSTSNPILKLPGKVGKVEERRDQETLSLSLSGDSSVIHTLSKEHSNQKLTKTHHDIPKNTAIDEGTGSDHGSSQNSLGEGTEQVAKVKSDLDKNIQRKIFKAATADSDMESHEDGGEGFLRTWSELRYIRSLFLHWGMRAEEENYSLMDIFKEVQKLDVLYNNMQCEKDLRAVMKDVEVPEYLCALDAGAGVLAFLIKQIETGISDIIQDHKTRELKPKKVEMALECLSGITNWISLLAKVTVCLHTKYTNTARINSDELRFRECIATLRTATWSNPKQSFLAQLAYVAKTFPDNAVKNEHEGRVQDNRVYCTQRRIVGIGARVILARFNRIMQSYSMTLCGHNQSAYGKKDVKQMLHLRSDETCRGSAEKDIAGGVETCSVRPESSTDLDDSKRKWNREEMQKQREDANTTDVGQGDLIQPKTKLKETLDQGQVVDNTCVVIV